MDNSNLSVIALRLQDARDEIVIAMRADDGRRDIRLKNARRYLADAFLSDKDNPWDKSEEWLVELIAKAITDSTDIDCTSESQARYVVDVLFWNLKPEGV